MSQTNRFGTINTNFCTNRNQNDSSTSKRVNIRNRDSSRTVKAVDSSVNLLCKEDATSSKSCKRYKLARLKFDRRNGKYKLLVPATIALWCIMVALSSIDFYSLRRGPNRGLNMATANEMFDDANESPGGGSDGFNDDDDDDDGAMDSSASTDYPEADGGGAEDSDDDPDGGESRQAGSWILPGVKAVAVRNRRDLDDVASMLQRRLAAQAKIRSLRMKRPEDMEFSVDDGDEDAWVHDGVDDIHIDPETKQAASQLSHDERSIDAEYEPHQANEHDALVNGTRITTISEVIPMRKDFMSADDGYSGGKESTRISTRFVAPPQAGASIYLPAAYLSMDQAFKLMDSAGNGGESNSAVSFGTRRLRRRRKRSTSAI